ncbi:anti-sigma factor [Luteipulveratus flavus]|uniref:Regulator of SigK n=1 Tax=Luteipulveratus flavus TaxID=3031728 RepID=A0ABT6C7Q5_9MICO|nr:anti-sigma factor [Luteipulveratus sp. YIM 133296]MDF8264342.1 anti-sigma factor [Luteipulveratus sp. YIM 133296]
MNDDEIHELAGAYALGAVDDIERASFERHLKTCAACQEEVASYDDALVALASTARPVAPPPALKSRIMDALPEQAPAPAPAGARPAHRPERRTFASRTRLLVAAAVVALLAGVGVGIAQPWQQPTSVASLSPAERVRLAPDAKEYQGRVGDGFVLVTASAAERAATITTDRLPPVGSDRTYQAWFLDASGTPRSAGLLRDDGPQLLTGVPGPSLALSVEPSGGSKAPTTKPVVLVALT